jgi:uracil-DNA glycosylase family 4
MADPYHQLLDATIEHLEQMKARGKRFVAIAPETLQGLRGTPRKPGAAPPTCSAIKAPTPGPAKPDATRAKVPGAPAIEAPTASSLPLEKPGSSRSQGLSAEAKAARYAELRQRVLGCIKCAHLASSRKNVVFGVGSIDAELMFIGEAPGADEDEQGEPFVGRAGQLLTKIIQATGLSRETVYIANILKCRPDTPGQSAGNRKPTPEEMQACIPYLHEQIDLIQPKVIVALGATAVDGLLGKTVGITKLRGQWQMYRGIPLMPTYHPAYLLRNQAPSEKRRVWEDMLLVMEKLRMPINERQRNYFLKGNG